MDDNLSVEAAIMDFVRFFPEEKQAEFELLLKRCNFHDVTDPGFPIMLFLLYFQEGICAKIESLEGAVRKNNPAAAVQPTQTPIRAHGKLLWSVSAVIAAVAAGVVLGLSFHGGPAVKPAKEIRREAPASMREINLYWRRKLAEDDRVRRIENQKAILFYGGLSVSAVLLSILCCLVCGRWTRRRIRRNPTRPSASSQIRALNLYNTLFPQIAHRKNASESRPETRSETAPQPERDCKAK